MVMIRFAKNKTKQKTVNWTSNLEVDKFQIN